MPAIYFSLAHIQPFADMRSRNINPFPSRTVRTDDCASVCALGKTLTEPLAHTAQKVAIAGRLLELAAGLLEAQVEDLLAEIPAFRGQFGGG